MEKVHNGKVLVPDQSEPVCYNCQKAKGCKTKKPFGPFSYCEEFDHVNSTQTVLAALAQIIIHIPHEEGLPEPIKEAVVWISKECTKIRQALAQTARLERENRRLEEQLKENQEVYEQIIASQRDTIARSYEVNSKRRRGSSVGPVV